VIERGAIHWVDLGGARGRTSAKRRPVLVVQADAFIASRLNTSLAVIVTSNTTNAAMPGNVFLPASVTGLPKDSTVNVTALVTLNKSDLEHSDAVGHLPDYLMHDVDSGLRLVLDL
jgi:mRNA interferase MazF